MLTARASSVEPVAEAMTTATTEVARPVDAGAQQSQPEEPISDPASEPKREVHTLEAKERSGTVESPERPTTATTLLTRPGTLEAVLARRAQIRAKSSSSPGERKDEDSNMSPKGAGEGGDNKHLPQASASAGSKETTVHAAMSDFTPSFARGLNPFASPQPEHGSLIRRSSSQTQAVPVSPSPPAPSAAAQPETTDSRNLPASSAQKASTLVFHSPERSVAEPQTPKEPSTPGLDPETLERIATHKRVASRHMENANRIRALEQQIAKDLEASKLPLLSPLSSLHTRPLTLVRNPSTSPTSAADAHQSQKLAKPGSESSEPQINELLPSLHRSLQAGRSLQALLAEVRAQAEQLEKIQQAQLDFVARYTKRQAELQLEREQARKAQEKERRELLQRLADHAQALASQAQEALAKGAWSDRNSDKGRPTALSIPTSGSILETPQLNARPTYDMPSVQNIDYPFHPSFSSDYKQALYFSPPPPPPLPPLPSTPVEQTQGQAPAASGVPPHMNLFSAVHADQSQNTNALAVVPGFVTVLQPAPSPPIMTDQPVLTVESGKVLPATGPVPSPESGLDQPVTLLPKVEVPPLTGLDQLLPGYPRAASKRRVSASDRRKLIRASLAYRKAEVQATAESVPPAKMSDEASQQAEPRESQHQSEVLEPFVTPLTWRALLHASRAVERAASAAEAAAAQAIQITSPSATDEAPGTSVTGVGMPNPPHRGITSKPLRSTPAKPVSEASPNPDTRDTPAHRTSASAPPTVPRPADRESKFQRQQPKPCLAPSSEISNKTPASSKKLSNIPAFVERLAVVPSRLRAEDKRHKLASTLPTLRSSDDGDGSRPREIKPVRRVGTMELASEASGAKASIRTQPSGHVHATGDSKQAEATALNVSTASSETKSRAPASSIQHTPIKDLPSNPVDLANTATAKDPGPRGPEQKLATSEAPSIPKVSVKPAKRNVRKNQDEELFEDLAELENVEAIDFPNHMASPRGIEQRAYDAFWNAELDRELQVRRKNYLAWLTEAAPTGHSPTFRELTSPAQPASGRELPGRKDAMPRRELTTRPASKSVLAHHQSQDQRDSTNGTKISHRGKQVGRLGSGPTAGTANGSYPADDTRDGSYSSILTWLYQEGL